MKKNKISEYETESPVLLNCWKHHAGFIKSKIIEFRDSEKFDFASFRKNLLRIGDSLMDLYLGELPPYEITGYIINLFIRNNIISRDRFILWLNEDGNEYREISLKDNSVWTLRLGEQIEKYIHIHPSRYSPQTIRVRALTLKSAILYLILNETNKNVEGNLQFINEIRKEYLNQPPLKSISPKSTLPKLVLILSQ